MCGRGEARSISSIPWETSPRNTKAVVPGPIRSGVGTVNAFGIYDLCENVHEWCADWYDPLLQRLATSATPAGPPPRRRRVPARLLVATGREVSRCAARLLSIPPDYHYTDERFSGGLRRIRGGQLAALA